VDAKAGIKSPDTTAIGIGGLAVPPSRRRIEVSPINHFLSEVLYSKKAANDYLDTLAEVNGNFKENSRED